MKTPVFDLNIFLNKKHYIKYHNLKKYIEQQGETVVEICTQYDGDEDEYTKYIEFFISNNIKLRGYFHDISSYDDYEPPYARFTLLNLEKNTKCNTCGVGDNEET